MPQSYFQWKCFGAIIIGLLRIDFSISRTLSVGKAFLIRTSFFCASLSSLYWEVRLLIPQSHCCHFSSLLSKKVFSQNDSTELGKTTDLIVDLDRPEPEVIKLVFRFRWSKRKWCMNWSNVEKITNNQLILRAYHDEPTPLRLEDFNESQFLLSEFLLDKQIVDVHGAKVERVNDLYFLITPDGRLLLSHVEVGFRGLLRRLGFQEVVIRFLKWFFDYEPREKFISWNYVQPLADRDRLKLQVPQSLLSDLHPADLADIIEDMDVNERAVLVESLNEEVLAEALEEMDPKIQVAIVRGMELDKAADIIEEMSPDEAADLIADLPSHTAQGIFQEMDDEHEETIKGLLAHEEDEAGGLMTTQFMTLTPDKTILDALAFIRQNANDMDVIYYVYIVDEENRLLGVTNIRELLSHDIFTSIDRIMTTRVITVGLDDDSGHLANLFGKYGFRGIPVVDEDNRMKGVVRFKALLEILAPHLGK
jgi:magnesium transporter